MKISINKIIKKQKSILITALLFVSTCSNNTSSPEEEDPVSYTPQNIGDVRQIVSHYDSSTILWTTIDTVMRSDGTKVYYDEWLEGVQDMEDRYLYVNSDNYFVGTFLYTVTVDSIQKVINPFLEQRLSKAYPKDGEYFIHTEGLQSSGYWRVKYHGKFIALCGEFDDTYAFELYHHSNSSLLITTYYAKEVGYIGAKIPDNRDSLYTCSYIKVGSKTYGHKIPAKDQQLNINKANKKIGLPFSIFGESL